MSTQYEQHLWEQQAQLEDYKEILEHLDDGVQIVDRHLNMIWLNQASEAEGTPREEIIGKNVIDLYNAGVFSDVVSPTVLKLGRTASMIAHGVNGKEMLMTGTPLFKDGEIEKIIIISRDITKLVELQDEIAEAKTLVKQYSEELEALRQYQFDADNIVFDSLHIRKTLARAKHVARTDATVLILGESGVGKEVLGRFIHNNSGRRDKPCVKIDCGAIPENLLESELFGYEEGAFTGAIKGGKEGLVQVATGGTLILDEVGELPLHMQAKLLRVIQDRVVVKVGGRKSISVDIRIIAITNRDLRDMVKSGLFREDLYYRLNVVPLLIPPLRERRDDIFHLAMKFLKDFNEKNNENKRFGPGVIPAFQLYNWPGNVRELENVVEMLHAISLDTLITARDLPEVFRAGQQGELPPFFPDGEKTYKDYFEEFEKDVFSHAAGAMKTVNEMAEKLHLDRSTIRKKLKRYGIR